MAQIGQKFIRGKPIPLTGAKQKLVQRIVSHGGTGPGGGGGVGPGAQIGGSGIGGVPGLPKIKQATPIGGANNVWWKRPVPGGRKRL